MCGEAMRPVEREVVVRIPGTSEARKHTITEWQCMECDHFEEVGTRGDEER